jgi:uncharacterized phage protein gp47/JayE
MAGVTSEGFVAKTVEEIKDEIETDELDTIDPSLNLQPEQPIGQINAIIAKKLAEVWELAQVAYGAFDRDSAEGRLLDNIGALTGTPREGVSKSLVAVTLDLDASFSKGVGEMMAHVKGQPEIKFTNRDAVTSTTAGTYTAWFESVDYGPVAANAGTLEEITTPITGWNSITNAADATPGSLEETDAAYRQRQTDELTSVGSSTVDAIRADLLDVDGVEQAFVFENVTMTTDGNGVPAKAIECVIYDGDPSLADDDEIAQAIWNTKPSGGEAYGSDSGTATDSLDVDQTVYFSRATIVPIYLEFDISVDASKFPVGGSALVKEAARDRGNLLELGDDVVALVLRASALNVLGVTDVVELRLGTSASPAGTSNVSMTARQIAKFDTARIVVNIV